MSQAPPKQSFVQTLILFVVIFLGFQLMCPKRELDQRKSSQIFDRIRELHKQFAATKTGGGELITGRGSISDEISKLEQQFQEGKTGGDVLSEAKKREMLDEAQLLLTDAQLKYGVREKNFTEVQMAYQGLNSRIGSISKEPSWTKQYPVNPMPGFERKSVSMSQLYADLESNARLLANDALVWGFMPGYKMIDTVVGATGAVPWFSYAFAALLLAVIVRGVVWPLAQKQYMWSRQMAQLAPLVKELREKYKGQEASAKMMELYQQYGINPMAGCAPALLQMPLFLLVYQCMLLYRFEFQKGTFLWINPSTSSALNGWVAPNLGERDYLMLILYVASMIVTQFLTPVNDPANVRQQRLMGIGMTLLFAVMMFTPIFPVPSAFVLYWIFTNLITTLQMMRAYRIPLPPLVKVHTTAGGIISKIAKEHATGDSQTKPLGNGFKATGAPKLHKPKKRKK